MRRVLTIVGKILITVILSVILWCIMRWFVVVLCVIYERPYHILNNPEFFVPFSTTWNTEGK